VLDRPAAALGLRALALLPSAKPDDDDYGGLLRTWDGGDGSPEEGVLRNAGIVLRVDNGVAV